MNQGKGSEFSLFASLIIPGALALLATPELVSPPSPHRSAKLGGEADGRTQNELAGTLRRRIMLPIMTAKVVTLRLAPAEYQRASALAKRRSLSLNRLFQRSLDLMERQEQEKDLFDDFSRIAGAADETDVEFALAAQTEATRKP